mgnify:CR=1 FL=1
MPRSHAMLEYVGKAARMNNKGTSLTELLVGLGLSSLVITLALIVYQICRQSWQTMSATDALYQNAQIALRAIRRQADVDGAAFLIRAGVNQVTLSSAYPDTFYPIEGLTLSHWAGVENRNHYRRDATLREDNTRCQNGGILANLALLRSTCLLLFSWMASIDGNLPTQRDAICAQPMLAKRLLYRRI